MTALGKVTRGLRTFASDIADGFFEITHNSFALLGLAVVFAVITLTARPDLRQAGEEQLVSWLNARQVAVLGIRARARGVRARHRHQPQGSAQGAGGRGLLAEQEVPRGARAPERPGGRSLRSGPAHQARPHPDPGHHGRGIELQPVCPERRGRTRPDAGHDAHPLGQVRELRRQAGRVRSGDQPARRREGACRNASPAPARSKAA